MSPSAYLSPKGMIPILEGILERLVAEMRGFADREDMFDLKETFGKYRVVRDNLAQFDTFIYFWNSTVQLSTFISS